MPSFATLLRAPNPGPMTLDGTNTWVLRGSGSASAVVVDPGPPDAGHLDAIVAAGPVDLVIVTHRHLDHTGALAALGERLPGVPVWASDPANGEPRLTDGARVTRSGLDIEVIATPGHTDDSVCLLVTDPATGERAMLTGDTILGRGTTVVAWPDGDLGDYLATLDRLAAYDGVEVLPGHGPELPDCGAVARAYRAHRDERIVQVKAALSAGARTPADVVAHVYPDLEPVLVPAAEWTVRAALAYLDEPT